ncbi:MAG TPA: site-specific integrase [Candidatus Limivivens intestinipullorum]|uniref:Site-specific integrase n=1 Tax=Candidatus Limivivens intestinipullorum TaxID=2840858 RepID=A0A9D1JL11_9FIRM|nr:site-specific integrase [Candidatus Limivivens intestinipullorum]
MNTNNKNKENITFGELFDEWYNYHCIEIAKSTAYGYLQQKKRIERFVEDSTFIQYINTETIQALVRYLLTEVSSTTVNRYCQTLKLCFDFAIKMGYISENPVYSCAIPKRRRVEIYPFTPEEINRLLGQPGPDWVKDGIVIAFRTGMRLGEIFALKWTDINFDEQFISVQRTQSRAGTKVEIKTTKSISGVRRIDIDTKLALHLIEMQERQSPASQYVFSSPCDPEKYRIPWNISVQLRELCQKAGIPERNFHTLRHTHASILFAHGKHPKMVQERLGHADVRTTIVTYTHITPTVQKEAVEVFENL